MATKKVTEPKPKRTSKKKVEEVVVEVAPIEVDAAPVERSTPTPDAIRARAFELWKARGGTAFDNWLAAEWELRGQA